MLDNSLVNSDAVYRLQHRDQRGSTKLLSQVCNQGVTKRRRLSWLTNSALVQGGSDISGTLSKLHCCIKKSYFLLIISHKTVLALFRGGNRNKQTGSGKY
jgi:hypothetical protein